MNIVNDPLPVGHPNRPGLHFQSEGVVIHRTGKDVGAKWLGDYFGRDPDSVTSTGRYGSSQYGVDDSGVYAYMEETEIAWHCSAEGQNFYRIGVETCQYFDEPPRIRPLTYENLVALGAVICINHGWTPRELAPDGEPRFTRHQDWDPYNRPNDPGDFLRWDDYLDDVELAILGSPWKSRKGAITVQDVLNKLDALSQTIVVLLARLQRGLDVETGQPFDHSKPPIDPRIKT